MTMTMNMKNSGSRISNLHLYQTYKVFKLSEILIEKCCFVENETCENSDWKDHKEKCDCLRCDTEYMEGCLYNLLGINLFLGKSERPFHLKNGRIRKVNRISFRRDINVYLDEEDRWDKKRLAQIDQFVLEHNLKDWFMKMRRMFLDSNDTTIEKILNKLSQI